MNKSLKIIKTIAIIIFFLGVDLFLFFESERIQYSEKLREEGDLSLE